MPEPIQLGAGVLVPGSAIEMRAVRSSGPGGQNVNKVASKVELRVDLEAIQGLAPDTRERLRALAALRLDAAGRLLVTSQRFRDQPRNLEDARDKVRALVARALIPPRPRRATRATAGSRERRLARKRRDAEKKRARRSGTEE
jgi:ribosome-associated protein